MRKLKGGSDGDDGEKGKVKAEREGAAGANIHTAYVP